MFDVSICPPSATDVAWMKLGPHSHRIVHGAGSGTGKSAGSLFSVADHTHTKMGARVLRGELLAPPCDLDLTRARQDAVNELM
jgi:DNA mismatch repair ATPase MutS